MSARDGGPAFPRSAFALSGVPSLTTPPQSGMSVRDYFAAKAMQGYAESAQIPHDTKPLQLQRAFTVIAQYAYMQADAMLAAREAQL